MAFPSTFFDLQVAVLDKLRLESPTAIARVKDWVNQTYTQACIDSGFTRSNTVVSLSAGQTSAALPATVAKVRVVHVQPSGGSYGDPLQRVSFDILTHYRAVDTTSATPTYFAILQNTLEFWHSSAGGESLRIWFVAKPTPLASANDVPVIDEPYASKVIEYGALAEAADFLGDPAKAEYRQLYEVWLQRLRAHVADRGGDQVEPNLQVAALEAATAPRR